jgi:hypothetical protein
VPDNAREHGDLFSLDLDSLEAPATLEDITINLSGRMVEHPEQSPDECCTSFQNIKHLSVSSPLHFISSCIPESEQRILPVAFTGMANVSQQKWMH